MGWCTYKGFIFKWWKISMGLKSLSSFFHTVFSQSRSANPHHTSRLTWVWVSPRDAASSARSGRARYCVLWKRLFSCWSWRLEYMVRGFRIFFPLPLILSCSSTWLLSATNKSYLYWESPGESLVTTRISSYLFSTHPTGGYTRRISWMHLCKICTQWEKKTFR